MKRDDANEQERIISLTRGKYYHIKSLSNELYLTVSNSRQYQKQKISLNGLNRLDPNQFWMIQQIAQETFQIVHVRSSMVMQMIDGQIRLRQDKLKNSQTFWLQKSASAVDGSQINIYLIKQFRLSKKHLYFQEDQLKCQEKNLYKNQCNKWKLQLITNHPFVEETCLIENYRSGLILQVFQASDKCGQKVIQNRPTKRFSQKWYIQRSDQFAIIKSLVSGLVLDIKEQLIKEGTSVIQYGYKDSMNQKWILQPHGKRVFLIRSALDRNYLLGIKGNCLKQQAELVITKNYSQSFWRIVGNLVI